MKSKSQLVLFCGLAWLCSGLAFAQAAKPAPVKMEVKASETAIDEQIPEDEATKAAIAPYTGKVRELEKPIGKLSENLQKFGIGGGTMGNIIADAMRRRAGKVLGQPVTLAVTNSSGLRKNSIKAGNLSTLDIYELLPFDNALVAVDLTGEQLRRLLQVITARRDAQSGARIVYRIDENKKNVVVNARLGDYDSSAAEIDPAAVYTLVTIDYLTKRGGEFAVLQEGKNLRNLNLTLRDVILDYIKAETEAGREIRAKRDGRFRQDRSKSTPNAAEVKGPGK